MLYRTHLLFAFMLSLIFIGAAEEKVFFIPIALAASLIPDIDSTKSYLGNRWYLRSVQWFLKHRGMVHSLSFCALISLGVSFVIPEISFSFFLGYSSHLIGDAITKEGIRPFWPLKWEIRGRIRTGGRAEIAVSLIFVAIILILLIV